LRPIAPGAAILSLAALLGLCAPSAALASPAPAAQPAATASNVLTLYSEPDLKGRHATYRQVSLDVERQGFVARSAASTGMWTLCEGGEVASRCQTVDGVSPELKLSPQIARPGLNALALYSEPGLKGDRIVYSFAADRPAPFHARSARTWGGPWSLCDRGFRRCQTLDGRIQDLDLVVAAVRPAPETDLTAPGAAPAGISTVPSHRISRPTPVSAHPAASKAAPRSRLVHVALGRTKAPHPAVRAHETRARPVHPIHERLLTPVRNRPRWRRNPLAERLHEARPVRYERLPPRASHVRLIQHVADRHARRAHAAHRRLYRRVRLFWGGGDPYLYAGDPRDWGPAPPW
jgi:hypothetical protein